VLCSPVNLIALLRTAGMIWHQHQFLENAEHIAEASQALFERVQVFLRHFRRVGAGLKTAEEAYNEAVRSYETRLVPAGRRVTELKGAQIESEMESLEAIEVGLRELPAAAEEPEA
jgi:DNA recombination protein RmuC